MRYQGLDRAAKPASSLLKAVANHRRLSILCHLAHAEHAVGELSEKVGLSQSALSQHLAKLRRDNLVSTRREAQTIYYSLNGERGMANVTEQLAITGQAYRLLGAPDRLAHLIFGAEGTESFAQKLGTHLTPALARV